MMCNNISAERMKEIKLNYFTKHHSAYKGGSVCAASCYITQVNTYKIHSLKSVSGIECMDKIKNQAAFLFFYLFTGSLFPNKMTGPCSLFF